jgi:hypothetical protein
MERKETKTHKRKLENLRRNSVSVHRWTNRKGKNNMQEQQILEEIALCTFQKCSRGPREGLTKGSKVEAFET